MFTPPPIYLLQEPLADAMLFEPIPYRAALAEGTNPNPNPSPSPNPNSNPNPYANPYSNPDS